MISNSAQRHVTALGTTRLVTDATGAVAECHDHLPFGEEVGNGVDARGACFSGDTEPEKKFTAKERDDESGLDYFGARYMSSAQGRFTSTDPLGANLVRVLNPQRWNMYGYAVNNPLAFTDPDGRDAVAVVFSNLAVNAGHAGIASVHHDGLGSFADFGPAHGGRPVDAGKYGGFDFNSKISYGADGKPTHESLAALANELADREGQPHDSVKVLYFRTTDAETAALDQYIAEARRQQLKGKAPEYVVGFRDCAWFCLNGLQRAGIGQGSSVLTVPNWLYLLHRPLDEAVGTTVEEVTSQFCTFDEKGKKVCQ